MQDDESVDSLYLEWIMRQFHPVRHAHIGGVDGRFERDRLNGQMVLDQFRHVPVDFEINGANPPAAVCTLPMVPPV